jgi:hypothetical protein
MLRSVRGDETLTRAPWIFLVSLDVSLVACVRTTDHHDGGIPDVAVTQPTLDARADRPSRDDGATDARASDAGAPDLAPLTP